MKQQGTNIDKIGWNMRGVRGNSFASPSGLPRIFSGSAQIRLLEKCRILSQVDAFEGIRLQSKRRWLDLTGSDLHPALDSILPTNRDA